MLYRMRRLAVLWIRIDVSEEPIAFIIRTEFGDSRILRYVPTKLHGVTLQQTVILKLIPGLDNLCISYL
jgi:hypothetical protein